MHIKVFKEWLVNFFQNDLCVLFLMLVLGASASIFLSNEMVWDFANYHYYNAFAFLHDRLELDIVPASVNTFFNPLIDLPLYYAITYFNDFPKIIYALQGLNTGFLMFALFKIFALFWDIQRPVYIAVVLFAVFLSVCGQATFIQIGTSTNEIQIACLCLWSLYILFKMIKFPQKQVWERFLFSGLIMGIALGLKGTALTWCLSSGLMLFCAWPYLLPPPHRFQNITLFAIGGLSGFLIVNGWWMLHLWELYQNPFFPFLNGIFHSPYFDDFNYTDRRFLPPDFQTAMIYPFVWFGNPHRIYEENLYDFRLTIYYLLLLFIPLYLVFKRRLRQTLQNCPLEVSFYIFMLLSYVLWLSIFSIYRYFVVYETLGSVLLLKAGFRFAPQKNVPLIFYLTGGILFLYILIATPLMYFNFPRMREKQFVWVEPVRLPENTLVKLYGFPTAAVIVELFKNNPTVRATGHLHFNASYMAGSDFAERGQFRKMRDKLEKQYGSNNIVIYFNSGFNYSSLEEYDKSLKHCEKMAEYLRVTENKIVDCQNEGNFNIVREGLRHELQDKYFCRELQNNIMPKRWFICVPKNLGTYILGENNA